MYKEDNVRQILSQYKITISERKMERRQRPISYCSWTVDELDTRYQIEEEIITIIKAEIPEKEFTAMADALCEMRDLMRDPETARLLMEARFINRLKGSR
jgi:hypothetical protein